MMVSLPVPPMMVLTLEKVPELVPLASVSVSAPEPRLTLPLVTAVARVIVSVPVPPISVLMLPTVPVLAPLVEGQLVGARAEIDDHAVGQRGGQRDRVHRRAACAGR